jgi:hypothetical protein
MADKELSPDQMIASLLQGKSRREMMVILARLEHGGAGIYQSFAANERNEKARAALLAGAEREEQNSALLNNDDAGERKVREVWQGAGASCSRAVLFISMHLLPRLRGRDEARVSELFG